MVVLRSTSDIQVWERILLGMYLCDVAASLGVVQNPSGKSILQPYRLEMGRMGIYCGALWIWVNKIGLLCWNWAWPWRKVGSSLPERAQGSSLIKALAKRNGRPGSLANACGGYDVLATLPSRLHRHCRHDPSKTPAFRQVQHSLFDPGEYGPLLLEAFQKVQLPDTAKLSPQSLFWKEPIERCSAVLSTRHPAPPSPHV